MTEERPMFECDVEIHTCPYCMKDVILYVELDGTGVIPHESYDLIANWVYHSKCWDEQMRRFPPQKPKDKLEEYVYKMRLTIGYPDMSEDEMRDFLKERNALFANPTLELAQEWWLRNDLPQWERPDVPLASVHKARLQWLEVTDEMIEESKKWLLDNGYEVTWQGAPPLTPEQRDSDRIEIGKKPLGES